MLILFIESIIVGIIMCIIGMILFDMTINKNNKTKTKPYGIDLAFFISGIIIYLSCEYFSKT